MGTCLQPVKAISRGVTRRAANQRAELGAKGGWGDPLAGTGVERRPRTQEETQRLSHPVSLGVSLEPGGDREADLGGLGPSPADGGPSAERARLEPGCGGSRGSLSFSTGLSLLHKVAQTGTWRSGNWLPSNLASQR